jgi:NAD kinase
MANIGVVIREKVEAALPLARELIEWATIRQHTVVLEENSADLLGSPGEGVTAGVLAATADPIVTLGGDGTLIGVAR